MALPGSSKKCSVAITDVATGSAVDPTALTVSVRAPDDTVTTYTYGVGVDVVKVTTGSYYIVVTVPRSNTSSAVGKWYVEWVGTGANADAGNVNWDITRSPVL